MNPHQHSYPYPYNVPAMGHHAMHPPRLVRGSVPLPEVRLSSLHDPNDERTLPPVPFVIKSRELHHWLKWGRWRPLPSLPQHHPAYPSGNNNELLCPATSPERRQLVMVVNIAGETEREVTITPEMGGRSAVSVYDVIKAVQKELWRAERRRPGGGAYHYLGQSACRGLDGIWKWCGLAEARDENDVWVLHL